MHTVALSRGRACFAHGVRRNFSTDPRIEFVVGARAGARGNSFHALYARLKETAPPDGSPIARPIPVEVYAQAMSTLSKSRDMLDLELVHTMLKDMPTLCGQQPVQREYGQAVRAMIRHPDSTPTHVLDWANAISDAKIRRGIVTMLINTYRNEKDWQALVHVVAHGAFSGPSRRLLRHAVSVLGEVFNSVSEETRTAIVCHLIPRVLQMPEKDQRTVTDACKDCGILPQVEVLATEDDTVDNVETNEAPSTSDGLTEEVPTVHESDVAEWDQLNAALDGQTDPAYMQQIATNLGVDVQSRHWAQLVASACNLSLSQGFSVYHVAKQSGVHPTLAMIQPMIQLLVASRLRAPGQLATSTAMSLWRDIQGHPPESGDGPDLALYQHLLRAIASSKHQASLSLVRELAVAMRESGVLIEPQDASVLVDIITSARTHALAVDYYRTMRAATTHVTPELYDTSLRALRNSWTPSAPFVPPATYWEIIRDMTWQGIPLQDYHYIDLLEHYAAAAKGLPANSMHPQYLRKALDEVMQRLHMDEFDDVLSVQQAVVSAQFAIQGHAAGLDAYLRLTRSFADAISQTKLRTQALKACTALQRTTDAATIEEMHRKMQPSWKLQGTKWFRAQAV